MFVTSARPTGKGVVCEKLGISHFVDDKIEASKSLEESSLEVLKSIFEDEVGKMCGTCGVACFPNAVELKEATSRQAHALRHWPWSSWKLLQSPAWWLRWKISRLRPYRTRAWQPKPFKKN